eukprot:CAMPEP_0172652950 /NCGR_PEP_ID=MMETSP1068-20121228/243578_1 /TAXON_ID=35684 /ORGANISM="Pseudopedinella elastica, Strain CCMP716" /LENGTH=685 /DNA_ID=CAMNT_0013467373 /DNA_START=80 /DNA_END=2137 /DNA_ORIENTATION=+
MGIRGIHGFIFIFIYLALPVSSNQNNHAEAFKPRKTAILVHGLHLQADGWEKVVWGDVANQKLGRVPHAIMLAEQEAASIVVFGTGGSEMHGVKEGAFTLQFMKRNIPRLLAFDSVRSHFKGMSNSVLADLANRMAAISVCETESRNTVEELEQACSLFDFAGVNRVILVSSPTHLPRVLRDAITVFEARGYHPTLLVSPSETCYEGCVAADVAVIEPGHRGDRDRRLDGELGLNRLVADALRVPPHRRLPFAKELAVLVTRHRRDLDSRDQDASDEEPAVREIGLDASNARGSENHDEENPGEKYVELESLLKEKRVTESSGANDSRSCALNGAQTEVSAIESSSVNHVHTSFEATQKNSEISIEVESSNKIEVERQTDDLSGNKPQASNFARGFGDLIGFALHGLVQRDGDFVAITQLPALSSPRLPGFKPPLRWVDFDPITDGGVNSTDSGLDAGPERWRAQDDDGACRFTYRAAARRDGYFFVLQTRLENGIFVATFSPLANEAPATGRTWELKLSVEELLPARSSGEYEEPSETIAWSTLETTFESAAGYRLTKTTHEIGPTKTSVHNSIEQEEVPAIEKVGPEVNLKNSTAKAELDCERSHLKTQAPINEEAGLEKLVSGENILDSTVFHELPIAMHKGASIPVPHGSNESATSKKPNATEAKETHIEKKRKPLFWPFG